jgi:probable F420-dependent oxidoreductase
MGVAQFSVRPPSADYLGFEATTEGIVEAAMAAEELGYDALVVNDHIIVDGNPRTLGPWGNTFDALTVLSFVAAKTSRIRIGTSVLNVPYRNPIATAKALATLDRMSGGRLVVGVGTGWSEPEFDALGVPFHERGARTNEYLRIWQACWGPDPVSFSGKFFSFADMHLKPKPLQQPHPPIWVGGTSPAALKRAARFAGVWQPTPMALPDLLKGLDGLRAACAAIGRAELPETRMSFRVNFSAITGAQTPPYGRPAGQGTPGEVAEDIRLFQEKAGVQAFQINFNGCENLGQMLKSMELFMTEVKPLVEAE